MSEEFEESLSILREYLRNAPKEELEEDWAKVKAMNLQGPTFTEIMTLTNEQETLPPMSLNS